MNVAMLNDIGITLAGILGIALFYWLGKKGLPTRRPDREEDKNTENEDNMRLRQCPGTGSTVIAKQQYLSTTAHALVRRDGCLRHGDG